MKKLILIFAIFAAVASYGQHYAKPTDPLVVIPAIDLADLSGADTLIKFKIQRDRPYSIQPIVGDTISGGAVGIYLQGSNDGATFESLTDSLSFAVGTESETGFFTGQTFPYVWGGILINKNSATEGTISVNIYIK
jgi:hypothetical protein